MENAKSAFKKRNANEPRRRVERIKDKNAIIKLKDSDYIRFDAKYNHISAQTWLDTGVSTYFIVAKKLAEEIGVRIVDTTQDSIKMMNGVRIKALAGIIDSIDLKSVKLYNVPVMIHERLTPEWSDTLDRDTKMRVETALNDRQIIMGLPTMKMIGKIEFDWKNRTICFPESTEEPATNTASNMFIINNNLYQQLKINGLNYVGYVDTGADDFIYTSFAFYERNKSHIEIDSIAEKKPLSHYRGTGIFLDVPYEIVKNPKIYSNGKNVNSNAQNVLISDGTLSHVNTFDGMIGALFFNHLGSKVIFDFDNMEIKNKD